MKRKIVAVIDIDTTIANNDVRAALLHKHCLVCGGSKGSSYRSHCDTCRMVTEDKIRQESWDAFLEPSVIRLDTPVPEAQRALEAMRAHGMEFHFITGRNERLRPVTEEWLTQYFGWDKSREALIMRSDAFKNSTASSYKEEALKQLISEQQLQDASFLFFEDDPYVFRMYSKYGVCVQCPQAWTSFCPQPGTGEEATWRR
jgi:predicted secreted acid phosphatase